MLKMHSTKQKLPPLHKRLLVYTGNRSYQSYTLVTLHTLDGFDYISHWLELPDFPLVLDVTDEILEELESVFMHVPIE